MYRLTRAKCILAFLLAVSMLVLSACSSIQPAPTPPHTSRPASSTGSLAAAYSGMTGYSNPQQYNQNALTIDNCKYVLNTYSMKFHRPACEYAHQMRPENALFSNDSRSEIISAGYKPCNWCKP